MKEEFELMWNGLDHENYEYDKSAMWFAWRMAWQAKAQAVPEGFALVDIEKLHEIRDQALNAKYASLNNDSDRIFSDIEDVQLSIEAMIEAQEQKG